nr:MAG TPA: terminase small subunit [Caudoviricetes sp.]
MILPPQFEKHASILPDVCFSFVQEKRVITVGAKGKYSKWLQADNLLLLQAWARDGLSDEQIAHNIGITTTTLYDWKKKYPAFSEALARGKEVVDIEVENALLKRAKGYDYIETTSELIADKNARNKAVMKVTKRVTRHVPPDVKALIFWLTNRKPEWRDKQEKELSGNIGINLVVDDDISTDD